MNKNKFRGYSKTLKRWIFGVPYFSNGEWWILVDDNFKCEDIGTGSYCIDKNSIGRVSEFKIKDNEIYEGDIIKGRKDTVYKVIFERGCFFLYHLNLFNPDKTNLRWGLLSRLFDSDMIAIEIDCEIIGNIYKNKDLSSEVK